MYTDKEIIKTCKIGNVIRTTTVDMFGFICSRTCSIELNEPYASYKKLKQIYYGWIPNYGEWARGMQN